MLLVAHLPLFNSLQHEVPATTVAALKLHLPSNCRTQKDVNLVWERVYLKQQQHDLGGSRFGVKESYKLRKPR